VSGRLAVHRRRTALLGAHAGTVQAISRSKEGLPPAAGASDSVKVRLSIKEPKEPP
jgi:hypothetical protein